MMLEISLDTLNGSGITAHQFLICRLISDNKYNELKKYLETTKSLDNLSNDIEHLAELNLIETSKYNVDKDFKKLTVKPAFKKLIANGSFFEELYETYPVKVVRDGGQTDYLRAERYNSKRIYDLIVHNNPSKHEHILKCLQAEVAHRQQHGTLGYMKRLYKWLATQEWKSFEERLDESYSASDGKEALYGTTIE